MAQEAESGSEWSPWRRGWVLPAFAWVFRVIAVGFIGYGVFSLAMRTAGIGIWKYGWVWSDLNPICMGGWLLLVTFAFRARTRKRGIVLFCIACLFFVIGVAILIAGISRCQYEPPARLTGWSALKDNVTRAGGILHPPGERSITKAISGLRVMR